MQSLCSRPPSLLGRNNCILGIGQYLLFRIKEMYYLFVSRLIASGKLLGQSQLSFLRDVGKPELAIMFIKDPQTRFGLALEANDLDAAFDAAKNLDSADSWIRLLKRREINIKFDKINLKSLIQFKFGTTESAEWKSEHDRAVLPER